MLNDMSFYLYYKMQGIKSAKMIAKLERTFSTALQNKKAKNNNKKTNIQTSLFLSHSQNLYVDEGSDKKKSELYPCLTCQHGRLTYLFFARRRGIQMTGALVVCHTGKISRHP